MTDPWLVGLDLDGTILLPDDSFSPGADAAITRLAESGHEVMIATGRNWAGTRTVMGRLALTPRFVVCANGAVVLRRGEDGEYHRFHVETFDPAVVLSMLEGYFPDAHYLVDLPDGSRRYTDVREEWNLSKGEKVSFADLAKDPVSRVVVISPEHEEADFHRIVERAGLNEVSYAVGWTAWLDIAPHGVHKGTGMERVRAELNWPGSRVLVAGDGRNDIGMFDWAVGIGGRAVAMAQSPPEVRAAASEITGDVVDGGLADVLRRLA